MAELSPMMKQYFEIKKDNPDSILFFRLGDFYEMFFDDAKIASEELDLVLTGRDCGQEERAPMCGVPYHSCESYIAKLISKGYRVAICEQTEDPSQAKGLVRREVISVITPGTVIDGNMLDEARNNYLCSVAYSDGGCGVCFVDASTGLLHLTELKGDDVDQRIIGEIGRFNPTELISNEFEGHPELKNFIDGRTRCRVTDRPKETFGAEISKDIILNHFNTLSLDNLGLFDGSAAVMALGSALSYLYETRKTGLDAIAAIDYYTDKEYMRLDISAMRNLELCETMRGGDKRGSLLWVLDKTKTALGKRKLRGMVEQPLLNISEINMRLNAVEEITISAVKRGEICQNLGGIKDLERLMSRVIYGTASARDLNTIAESLGYLPEIKNQLESAESRLLKKIYNEIDLLSDVVDRIHTTIDDEPAATVREGNIIRKGFSAEVDELRDIFQDGKNFITKIEATERENTGIKTLKVRYNKVFGYYIEVPNSFKGEVPETYIRKQTLTNCERYITDELKTLESRVLGARERVNQLEYEIFDELRGFVAENRARILATADAIARIDAISSLAEIAVRNNYTRPGLNDKGVLRISDGRHPVIEQISRNPFVPNDTTLDIGDNRCAIITGPNMAGKSTYMRQVALITIMAQIGSFVPASFADVSICDAVYTRVGASDDLSSGQSTFMVEMSEVAYILKNATKNSLLILDEIGRGTSTYDGMSIARAVLEHCCDRKKIGAKTLFATHYHELTALEAEIKGVKNYNIAAKKHGDDITFLRKIVRGGADDSYGIEVAKLSGIPLSVINRAKQVLAQIESEGGSAPKSVNTESYSDQISLIDQGNSMLTQELSLVDVNNMTPITAMQTLAEFVEKAKNLN